jgi:hypothetical protein
MKRKGSLTKRQKKKKKKKKKKMISGPCIFGRRRKRLVVHVFLVAVEIMGAWFPLESKKLITQFFFLVYYWSPHVKRSFYLKA